VSHIDVGSVTSEDIYMGKLIWRGWVNLDERISSQVSIITGANLRKLPQKPVEKHEKEPKKKQDNAKR